MLTQVYIHGGPKSTTEANEQGRIFLQYLQSWDFTSTHLHLNPSLHSHTYVSDAHSSVSTIDHIISPSYLLDSFNLSAVLDDHPLNSSDHLPLYAEFKCSLGTTSPITHPKVMQGRPNWKKCSVDEIQSQYSAPLQSHLHSLLSTIPSVNNLVSQPSLVDDSLASLTSCLHESTTQIPKKHYYKHRTPKWSGSLKEAQKKM